MSFSSLRKQSLVLRVVSILVSVCIATAMWYMVSVRDRIEMQVSVNIDYTGIPKNLIVTDGLINKLTVRVRGPEALLKGIATPHLTQQIDLSLIKKGVSIVPLTAERLSGYYRAFDVLDVQPPRLVVKADVVVERTVPVTPEIRSSLRKGAVTVSDVSVSPPSVTLRGPEAVVVDITSLKLPVEVDPGAGESTVEQSLPLDSPGLVTVTPNNVTVTYTITSKRIEVASTCKIHISTNNPEAYAISPSEVTLTLEVPEQLAKNAPYLSELKLDVVPPADLKPGMDVGVPVHYRIPDGMTVVEPRVEEILIRRKAH